MCDSRVLDDALCMTADDRMLSRFSGKRTAAAVALPLGLVGLLTDSEFWSPAFIVVSLVLAIGSTVAVLLSRSQPANIKWWRHT